MRPLLILRNCLALAGSLIVVAALVALAVLAIAVLEVGASVKDLWPRKKLRA